MVTRNKQGVLFEDLFHKPVRVEFTQPGQSSDGGVVLLRAADESMKLIERVAAALGDSRQRGKVTHEIDEMLRERIYGIACGYPDCNDAGRLATDPAMVLACDGEERLASQPTLTRLENAVKATDLLRAAYAFTDVVLECESAKRRRKDVRRIVIDMDSTADPTHGDQQLTFFNAFYDTWCYQPMVTTIQFDDDSDQILVAPVLRPGNAKGSLGAVAILKRLVPRLRQKFPRAKIVVRMDGAFAAPEVFAWLEGNELRYVINMPKNSVLQGFAEPLMNRVRRAAKETDRTQTEFGEAPYQAGKWKAPRRAIIKAEVTAHPGRELRDNPRFVITNLSGSPKKIYRFYCERGDMENRIKELHALRFDLTSCSSFRANQLRNLLTAAAAALLQRVRYAARGTECETAQVWTLRDRLLKIGVRIGESIRRILIEGPLAFPWYPVWRRVALALGASP
jgi:hypothetical protein